jgi:hypothetical protein
LSCSFLLLAHKPKTGQGAFIAVGVKELWVMVKQVGDIKLTGTVQDITFYGMEGQYYARRKSSLKGTRVTKDPRFKRTMQGAHRLAKGSQLAANLYRTLPRAEQVYALFKELRSLAIRALKAGKSEEEVLKLLQQRLVKPSAPVPPLVKKQKTRSVRTTLSLPNRCSGGGRKKRSQAAEEDFRSWPKC